MSQNRRNHQNIARLPIVIRGPQTQLNTDRINRENQPISQNTPVIRRVFLLGDKNDSDFEVDTYFVADNELDPPNTPFFLSRNGCIVPKAGHLSRTRYFHPTAGKVDGTKPIRFLLMFTDEKDEGKLFAVELTVTEEIQRKILASPPSLTKSHQFKKVPAHERPINGCNAPIKEKEKENAVFYDITVTFMRMAPVFDAQIQQFVDFNPPPQVSGFRFDRVLD